jgi:hypothetical protein
MHDLLQAPFLSPLKDDLVKASQFISNGPLILATSADLEGLLALGFLEAALLDAGISYSRRFIQPMRHIPRDEQNIVPEFNGTKMVFIDSFAKTELSDSEHILILKPTEVEVQFPHSEQKRRGTVDAVVQSSALASMISPNGAKTSSFRSYLGAGQWLMEGLDTTIDPIHTLVRDFLRDEGTIQVLPLPEIAHPCIDMIPGLSERRLKKLSTLWADMNANQRSQALSEFSLPALSAEGISTARFEELMWKRMIIPGQEKDLASILYILQKQWPETKDESILFASRLLDSWLRTGHLVEATD